MHRAGKTRAPQDKPLQDLPSGRGRGRGAGQSPHRACCHGVGIEGVLDHGVGEVAEWGLQVEEWCAENCWGMEVVMKGLFQGPRARPRVASSHLSCWDPTSLRTQGAC